MSEKLKKWLASPKARLLSYPRLKIGLTYWLVPLLLFLVQVQFTLASMSQIRYEELAESIRNPWWVQHGYIFDGISSNVGWYGTLVLIYHIFGFSLFTTKYFRLVLHLLFLLSLASLFRRAFGSVKALLPLITVGLSPVLLYYNTFQTSYGTDLQYAGICLFLAVQLKFSLAWNDRLVQFLLWTVVIIAAMSYPTFLLYIPALLLFLWWKARENGSVRSLELHGLTAMVGFLLPLLGAFALIKNRELLVYDAVANGAGLFRGGGKIKLSWPVLEAGIRQTCADLFDTGSSFYFDLARPDFSGPLMIFGLPLILFAGIPAARKMKNLRAILGAGFLLLLINLIIPNTSEHLPGMRRCTGILAGIYVIFGAVYYFLLAQKSAIPAALRLTVWLALVLIPIHSLLVIPDNLKNLRQPGLFLDSWFTLDASPEKSLQLVLAAVEHGQGLFWHDGSGHSRPRRYHEVYATIAGYRKWNGLPEIPVVVYDWRRKEYVSLSLELWKKGRFPTP